MLTYRIDGELITSDQYMERHPDIGYFRALHEINEIVNRQAMEIPDIPTFLDRRPSARGKPLVYTFSILNSYLNCPEQMQRRYLKKDLGPYVETKEIAWGNRVHTAFEKRVGSGQPLPADMEKWETFAAPFDNRGAVTEQQLGIDSSGNASSYWDPPVWFRGKVDVTLVQKNVAYINDWKSGSGKYEHPFEIATNAVLLKGKYPHLQNIFGSYTWLKENRMSEVYDLSDTASTLTRMREIIADIERDRQLDEWHKKKSGLCGWCNVKDCEHNVPRS